MALEAIYQVIAYFRAHRITTAVIHVDLTVGTCISKINLCENQGPLLLTWFNFNPSMNK